MPNQTLPTHSMITTLPKFHRSGTHGYTTSARILPPKTGSSRTYPLHGRRYVCLLLPTLHLFMLSPQPWTENLTGTRGAFKTYNTTRPKYEAWQPKTAARG